MKDIYIITGTTSGLGLAFAKELHQQGKTIYSISRSYTKDMHFIPRENVFICELSLSFEIKKNMVKILSLLQEKDLNSITLINNAGVITPIGNVGTNSVELADQNIKINLIAPITLSEIFTCAVANWKTPKYILNISSGAATTPYAGWSSYCASKAGLNMLTQCMGEEQKTQPHPIKVIAFAPGVIDTKMQQTIRKTPKENFSKVERFIDLKENNQLLSPDFVAQKILTLLTSSQTSTGNCYDIRDFINQKQGKK